MTDDQKALSYYKAAVEQESPPFVPSRVRVLREVIASRLRRGK